MNKLFLYEKGNHYYISNLKSSYEKIYEINYEKDFHIVIYQNDKYVAGVDFHRECCRTWERDRTGNWIYDYKIRKRNLKILFDNLTRKNGFSFEFSYTNWHKW